MSGQALTYVEIDIQFCALSYGVAPCTASIPTTGADKCFNSFATCQDSANFDPETVTLRFAINTGYLPDDIEAIPYIDNVSFSPAAVSLGENVGQRASLEVTFNDYPHSDTGEGIDKYHTERSYNPFNQGTFWGKFRARQPFLKGVALRWINGFVGQTLAEMETRHFFIESFTGLRPDGKFSIIAKDALKSLDGDRAQMPVMSRGFLVADISDSAGEATLSPAGIGDEEYETADYYCIGGNEVCYVTRDPYTKALLEFNGTDGATSTADVKVANPHAVTFFGSAQLDTGIKKFGTASLQLGSAGNYIQLADSDDWFLSNGNFTIDLHVYFTTAPSGAPNGTIDAVLFWQEVDANNRLTVSIDGTSLVFFHGDGGVGKASYSATHALSNATWHHLRFVRSGTSFFIFKDGVSLSLTTTTAISTNTLNNLAAPLRIGGQSVAGPDRVDNVRWRKGIADTTSGFTPPAAEYELTGSGDVIRITRAQRGTVASSHSAQDRVQLCITEDAQDPADILYRWITTYTDLDAGYIDLPSWQAETAAYLNRVFTFTLTEPIPVKDAVSRLIVQAGLALWDDNVGQQLKLQVLRAVPTGADRFSEDNIVRASFQQTEQPEKRVTQVYVYFGQKDPTKRYDDPDNYRASARWPDVLDEETGEGIAIKKIFANGIPGTGGRTVAERIAEIQEGRYRTAPRKWQFKLMRGSVITPQLGGGYQLSWHSLQEASGLTEDQPIQITRLNPPSALFDIEAEESRFTAANDDPNVFPIVFDTNSNNVNLRDVFQTLYGTPASGIVVNVTIAAGVIIGSTLTSLSAFDVGTWADPVTINILVLGRIQGRGGNGGNSTSGSRNGGVGGVALYTREAVNLTDASGELFGGAGGGAGGEGVGGSAVGGGGGAGKEPGLGGSGTTDNGDPGTTDAGGAGGTSAFAIGGAGGGPGLAGAVGTNGVFGTGGSPGLAIDGISFVTTIGSPGDRRGGTAN